MQALVVSAETLIGGQAINEGESSGFNSLRPDRPSRYRHSYRRVTAYTYSLLAY